MPLFGTVRWGAGLWGAGAPIAPGNPAVLDVQRAFLDVIYRLGFSGIADIGSQSWVTPTELFQWADEAAKRLAYLAGVFVTYDPSMTGVIGTAVYTLPANHVFTIAAWLGGQHLRLTSAGELSALDGLWAATTGPAKRASLDAGGVGTITLYPVPTAGGPLAQVCAEFPGPVAAGSSLLALPTVMQDYFSYAMLRGARFKESDARMPEMAGHFEERMRLYEAIAQDLWGRGQ